MKHTISSDRDDIIQRTMKEIHEASDVLAQIASGMVGSIVNVADDIVTALSSGKKLIICGNGGSAAHSQHLAAELVGHFRRERQGWAAISLTADTSVLTSLANDYGFERVFAHQVQALGQYGDILMALSTSGNSTNVLAAVKAAELLDMRTIGMTGINAGQLGGIVNHHLAVPSTNTAIIQQGHMAIIHLLCEIIEEYLI